MFLGEYRHNLDEKNRLAVPSKFRQDLKGGLIVTKGLDNCLFVYPIKQWNEWAEKLSKLPISQAKSRAFLRMMLGGAMEMTLDKQGRIVIPDYLVEYGKLSKQIVLAGLYDRIELWNAEEWKKYKSKTEKDRNDIAETLAEMGV